MPNWEAGHSTSPGSELQSILCVLGVAGRPSCGGLNIAALATEAARQGVVMSTENSGQTIRSPTMLVQATRARLSPAHAPYSGLCPDPTNQLRRFPGNDPLNELDGLALDIIKSSTSNSLTAVRLTSRCTMAT